MAGLILPQMPPKRDEAALQEEEELQLAIALSQSEAEEKERMVSRECFVSFYMPWYVSSLIMNRTCNSCACRDRRAHTPCTPKLTRLR